MGAKPVPDCNTMDFKGFLHLRSYEAMYLNQIFVKMPRFGILAKGAYKFVIPSESYLSAQNRSCVTKCGARCLLDCRRTQIETDKELIRSLTAETQST